MKITDDQREAINDIIIDALMTPPYKVFTNDIMSEVRKNPEWDTPADVPIRDDVYRKQYFGREHKKDAKLMCAVLNADAIVKKIEQVAG